jgi:hypothetical protein
MDRDTWMAILHLLLAGVGSGFGAYFGACFFWKYQRKVIAEEAKPSVFKQYSCANDQNLGDANETDGQLKHHFGTRLDDPSELKKLDAEHAVWEWNRTPCGDGKGDCLIYGPYATEFTDDGPYSAVFRIKATGLPTPEDIKKDAIMVELDVNLTEYKLISGQEGPLKHPDQQVRGRRFLTARELAKKDWQEFEVAFKAAPLGLWEYRVFAYDGMGQIPKPDNIADFGTNVRIIFDTVTIKKHNPTVWARN